MANGKDYYGKDVSIVPIATNADPDNPIGNINTDDVNEKFKTITIGPNTITWNYSVAPNIKAIGVFNHSQPDTIFKVEASNDNFSSTLVTLDLSILTVNSMLVLNWTLYKDIRLRFEDSVNVQEIGSVFLALSEYSFLRNYNTNFPGGTSQTFSRNITISTGSISKKQQVEKYIQKTVFSHIEEAQYLTFKNIAWNNMFLIYLPKGDGGPFYFGDQSFPGLSENVGHKGEYKNQTMNFEEQK